MPAAHDRLAKARYSTYIPRQVAGSSAWRRMTRASAAAAAAAAAAAEVVAHSFSVSVSRRAPTAPLAATRLAPNSAEQPRLRSGVITARAASPLRAPSFKTLAVPCARAAARAVRADVHLQARFICQNFSTLRGRYSKRARARPAPTTDRPARRRRRAAYSAPQSLSPTSRGHSRRPAETTHSHRPALQQPAPCSTPTPPAAEPNDAAEESDSLTMCAEKLWINTAKPIAGYEEHSFYGKTRCRVSTELNNGRVEPLQQRNKQEQEQKDDTEETTAQSPAEAHEIETDTQELEQKDDTEETIAQSPEEMPERTKEYAIDEHQNNYEEDFEKCNSEIVIEKILIECREKLFMRKDNYAFFIDCDGRASDEGALQLLSQNKLKTVKSDPGEVTIIKRKQSVEFAICIKSHNDSTPCIIDNIEKGLLILKTLIEKLGIDTISIAKSQEISHVPWAHVENMLKTLFVDIKAKIIICKGEIKFVTLQERQQVLRDMHASAIGGHKGIAKTMRRMKPIYYWKSMKSDIIKFIQRCDTCQLKKLVRKKVRQPMVISDTPYEAMEKVAIDIVGPLPRTKKGNINILTIQCNLTKFCRAIALQDATAETVADAFLKEFICIFSCPQIILSDQGTNFTSKVFVNLAKAFKIKTVTTTAYRPSSNGSLERSHHSLAEYLKTVAGKNKEWDDILEMAMFSYNTSVHEAHQFQPFQLVFGKLPTLPTAEAIEKSGKIVTYTDYVRKLCKTLSEIKSIAREKLIDAKLRNKFYYDKKSERGVIQTRRLCVPTKGRACDWTTNPLRIRKLRMPKSGHDLRRYSGRRAKQLRKRPEHPLARPLFEKSASSSSTNHRPPSTPTPCRPIRRRNHSRPPAEVTLADQPRQHSHRPALQQPAPAAHRHLQLLSRTTPPKKATHYPTTWFFKPPYEWEQLNEGTKSYNEFLIYRDGLEWESDTLSITERPEQKSFTESNRLHFSVMFFRFTQLPLGCFGVIHRLSDTRGSTPQCAGSAKACKK
ncbi:unnamed protein product, partial [Trichogramma brassicae]